MLEQARQQGAWGAAARLMMLPLLGGLQGCMPPAPEGHGGGQKWQCSVPENHGTVLPGFDTYRHRVSKVVHEDLSGDGRLDLLYLTEPREAASAPDKAHVLDVLACDARGQWKNILHKEIQGLEATYLEVCPCRWDDPDLPADAAGGPQGQSILILGESRGASGWTLTLEAYRMREGRLLPLPAKQWTNVRHELRDERLILRQSPSFAQANAGQRERTFILVERGEGALEERDIDALYAGGPGDGRVARPSGPTVGAPPQPTQASVTEPIPAPPTATGFAVFRDLAFCTEQDFDQAADRCGRSLSTFPADTRRIYYSWHASGTEATMGLGQVWWLDGDRQGQMSSPPNPRKPWRDPWEEAAYNYSYIDACSRDPLALCDGPLTPGLYELELSMDELPLIRGDFVVQP